MWPSLFLSTRRLCAVTTPRRPGARRRAPWRRAPLLLLGLLLGTLAAHAQGPAAPPVPEVVAFGDLRGELLPCGCSPEGQFGGLPRREGYWNALLRSLPKGAAAPLLVDLGNNFPEPSAQGQLKIEVIQPVLRKLALEAILPGPHELQVGYGALDRKLPYLVTNNEVPGAFLESRTAVRQGARTLILGYLSPDLVYQGSQDRYRLSPLSPALLSRFAALIRQAQARRVLLLFRGDDAELAQLAASGMFQAIVAGNPSGDELTAPRRWPPCRATMAGSRRCSSRSWRRAKPVPRPPRTRAHWPARAAIHRPMRSGRAVPMRAPCGPWKRSASNSIRNASTAT